MTGVAWKTAHSSDFDLTLHLVGSLLNAAALLHKASPTPGLPAYRPSWASGEDHFTSAAWLGVALEGSGPPQNASAAQN